MKCAYCNAEAVRLYGHGLRHIFRDERIPYCDGGCRFLHWQAVMRPPTYEQIKAADNHEHGQLGLL